MNEIMKAKKSVVYFTAVWCQPCKQLKPIYAKAGMADENNDYFVVDVDSIDKEYMDLYNIKSVPTIYKLEKGVIQSKITARTAEDIIKQANE